LTIADGAERAGGLGIALSAATGSPAADTPRTSASQIERVTLTDGS
jgi:hypothetical protein